MKKQVAPFAAPTSPAASVGAIANYAKNKPASGGTGLPYLRLLKGDGWHYGAEDVEVEEGSQWAINISNPKHGYVCWTDNPGDGKNEKLGEVSFPLSTDLPAIETLEDHGWEWKETITVEMTCISGVDKGTAVQYNASSYGGIQMCRKLFADIGVQYDVDPTQVVPIITLGSSHYAHKKHGRVYKPEYEIIGWAVWGKTEVKPAPKKVRAPAAGKRKRSRAA